MITIEQKTKLIELILARESRIDTYVRVPNTDTQKNANEAIKNLYDFIDSITEKQRGNI